mgnify:CR=1 FL=1
MQKKISTSLVASLLLATTNLFSAQSLEPITVTSATKSTQSIKDVTSNIEVITKEEIEEKHFTTVTQALNTLSGVSVVSNGGLGNLSSVFVRGMDSKRVLVLIDGIRYNDVTGTSGAPFEHLMIDDIEQIEVVKGAQSGIWGADASAGVINIITKSAKVGTHGNATVEYGSFNSKKYGMNISHKTEKYYVNGSAYETDTDGYSAQAPRYTKVADLEDDGYKNLTANLKAGYNFNDSNKIDLSHTLIDARSEYDGCGNEKWKTSFGGYYSCSDTILQKANNSSYFSKTKDTFDSVNYNNINSFSKIDVYANSSKFNREYNDTQKYTGGVDNGKTLSSKNEFDGTVKELGFKTDIPYQNDNAFIILGTDYKTFEHENDINEQYNNKAIFVTNSNKFNNGKTIITESLRKDAYDKFDDKTTGKVGIKQYIVDELNISSNYGTGYNVPTIYQLFEPAGMWGPVGNINLEPEKTKGYDIGFEYKGFGVDALFQGVGHYSVILNTASVYWPLRNNTNISNWYLNDRIRWTEETKDIANVPRLTTLDNANNFRNSTQWLENGSYFKLRNLNVYYNLPSSWAKKVKMEKIQVYARANNLFSLDHVKYMNCEDLKINYPDMTSVYFGLNINF